MRPNDLADCNPVVGRHFLSKSGNLGKIERLGDGALRINWARGQTQEDEQELHEWLEMVLGVKLNPTDHRDTATEQEALARWRQEMTDRGGVDE